MLVGNLEEVAMRSRWLLLAAVLGIVFVGIVRMIGRWLTPWAPEDNSPGQI